jgi:SAM-dependent methyltransferase
MNHSPSVLAHDAEVESGERFAFGANWTRFLGALDEERIQSAVDSLGTMLDTKDLKELSFLDIGSGSGLFSLAARRLGAQVYSFDYDPGSVACTQELKRRFYPDDPYWHIEHGSVLDRDYLNSLGRYDVVYSWGVLHHSGKMWDAMANASLLIKGGGLLFIAIYNDQGWRSRYWKFVKRLYNLNPLFKYLMVIVHLPLFIGRVIVRGLRGRLREGRGMSLWHDYIDWLGGYPFETAAPQQVIDFYCMKGLDLVRLKSVGKRSGCNEYVFRRSNGE